MDIIPLFTSAISFVFVVSLLNQFIKRCKIYQVLLMIALLFFGISTLMELLMNPDIFGFSLILFRIFYVTASSLVGFLGAGQLYLILKNKISPFFLLFVIIFTLAMLSALIFTPFPTSLTFVGELGEDIRVISNGYPMTVRIYAIIIASVGGMVFLLGSLCSFVEGRTRYYALFFTLGAVFPLFRNFPFGYLGNELASVISLFIGFILSLVYLKKA